MNGTALSRGLEVICGFGKYASRFLRSVNTPATVHYGYVWVVARRRQRANRADGAYFQRRCHVRRAGCAVYGFAVQSYAGDKAPGQASQLKHSVNVTAHCDSDLNGATSHGPLSPFAMTDDARRTWEELPIGRKREIARILLTVTLPPLGRGHTFSRDLIQVAGPTAPARAA